MIEDGIIKMKTSSKAVCQKGFMSVKSSQFHPMKKSMFTFVRISRPQGYKAFMLNSTEQEIYHAHEC